MSFQALCTDADKNSIEIMHVCVRLSRFLRNSGMLFASFCWHFFKHFWQPLARSEKPLTGMLRRDPSNILTNSACLRGTNVCVRFLRSVGAFFKFSMFYNWFWIVNHPHVWKKLHRSPTRDLRDRCLSYSSVITRVCDARERLLYSFEVFAHVDNVLRLESE